MADGDPVRPAAKPLPPITSSHRGLLDHENGEPAAVRAPGQAIARALVPPLPASSAALPGRMVPTAASAPKEAAILWPKAVPDLTQTLSILRGHVEAPPRLQPQLEEVLASLSKDFRELLRNTTSELSPGHALLARSSAVRWRVTAALATRPGNGESDPGAVDGLFSELDGVLTQLSESAGGAPEELQGELGAERVALAKAAVDLSEAVQVDSERRAQEAVAASGQKYKAIPNTRLIATGENTHSGRDRRQLPMLIVFALVVLAGGAYHGYRALTEPAPVDAVANLPKGTFGSRGRSTTRFMVHSKDGKAFDPATLEKIKDDARNRGQEVELLSPGTAVVFKASADSPPPAAGEKP